MRIFSLFDVAEGFRAARIFAGRAFSFRSGSPFSPPFLRRALFAAFLWTPAPVLAGQTVTVDGDVSGNVWGNGDGNPPHDSSTNLLDTDNNTVIVNSGTISLGARGAYKAGGFYPIVASGNTVIINGGTVNQDVEGACVLTGTSSATGTGNTVTIFGGTMGRSVIGAHVTSQSIDDSSTATSNTVTISGGTVNQDVVGGYAYNGQFGAATATGNTVTISGGTLGHNVIGGYAYSYRSSTATATGNTVTISGGTVVGDVFGGYAYGSNINTATVMGNIVAIATTGETYANLYGGAITGGGTGDAFTDNELNLAAGNTITSAQNFNTVNFTSAGDAGIATLDATATGAAGNPLVTLNTDAYNVGMAGAIIGTGGIDKTGAGTL
ncbi:MAG: hypothetical protein LBG69_08160, partial [Zoogloeaceae bacterium]|nr:hypothetical protein [Zoogloeaceae bacterium]